MQRLCTLCGLTIKEEAQARLDDPFNDSTAIQGIGCVCMGCQRTLTKTRPNIAERARQRLRAKA